MPGKNFAIVSLVCGIISAFFTLLAFGAIDMLFWYMLCFVLGIVSIIFAVNAKKKGYIGGIQKAGLVLGIISTILCGTFLAACALCAGAAGAAINGLKK